MSSSTASDRRRCFGNIVKNNIFYKNADCGGGADQTFIGNSAAVRLDNNAILKQSPGFVNEGLPGLRLTAGSPMIDAGAFVTRTVGGGSGNVLGVEDVGYFYDGFGIPGETGDLIQLEGGSSTARIIGIDYKNRALALDQSITWTPGQYLHLRYSGVRPDIGAFEFQMMTFILPPTIDLQKNPR